MNYAVEFRELVSGRRRGIAAGVARVALRVAEVPYAAAVRWRNRRYDAGHAEVHLPGVPVISVGNLTLGGTGKTPMVKWIARWLRGRGARVSIVSRGYAAAAAGTYNDEAIELAQMLPDVPHLQNRDRVAAVQAAIDEFDTQVILLDDGFQHRRLGRDLDIVLIDALEPDGFGHIFPRGTLREPIRSLCRADMVCLTRADMVDPGRRHRIRQKVLDLAPSCTWCEVSHAPRELRSAAGEVKPLHSLHGRRAAAFCGIGNPEGFRHALSIAGCKLAAWRVFADHHPYNKGDIADLQRWATHNGADVAVCTHKDLVKLQVDRLGSLPLWAVIAEMEVLQGLPELERALVRTVSTIGR